MDYKVKTVPIIQVPVTPMGPIEPLCNSCKVLDCTNPIQKSNVSMLGVLKNWKMYFIGNDPYLVIFCEGYLSCQKEDEDTD